MMKTLQHSYFWLRGLGQQSVTFGVMVRAFMALLMGMIFTFTE